MARIRQGEGMTGQGGCPRRGCGTEFGLRPASKGVWADITSKEDGMESLEAVGEAMVRHLQGKGYTPATVTGYGRYVKPFLAYLAEKGVVDLRRVTVDELLEYRQRVLEAKTFQGKPYRWGTVCLMIRSAKTLFDYLEETGQILLNPAVNMKEPPRPHRLPHVVLNREEVEEILRVPDTSTSTGMRDQAILEVFYSTGLRLGELIRLRVEDVDQEGGFLRVESGKGGKSRVVPLGQEAMRFVKGYLLKGRPHLAPKGRDEKALFVNKEGNPVSKQAVEIMVRMAGRRAGIGKPVSPHTLRHTFATLMVKNGAPVEAVSKMLGHVFLSTTQVYTHVAGVDVKKAHGEAHPRERGKAAQEAKAGAEPTVTAFKGWSRA